MLALVVIKNGQKKYIPLTADAGAGNPVGSIIVVCSNRVPSNYLPLGTQFDTTQYPLLYAELGTDTTPTASSLNLPTLSSGQYVIKATSGLSENAQDNVINTLNEQRSYSTEEVNTGKKWIDGKPIYRKVWTNLNYTLLPNDWFVTDISNSGYDTITEIKVMNNAGTLFNFVGCTRNIGNTLQLWSTRNVDVEMNILVLEYTKTV
jgi:hypothetical protein